MRRLRRVYDIWAIDKEGQPIEGTETKAIKGKAKAMKMAIALFRSAPETPWRVVIQPRHYHN